LKLKKENIEQIYVGESGSIRKEFVVKLVVLAVLPTMHILWPGGQRALKVLMII